MDKIEDKFIKLLERVKDEELKGEFLKCFFEVSDEIEQLKIKNRSCCISTCQDICNGNDVDAKVDV